MRTTRRVLRLAGVVAGMALVASACSFPRFPRERPTVPPLPQTSLVFDSRGRLITALHAGENRTLISLSEVPKVVRDAVVASEDERFYQHHGVDAKALLRAALHNAERGRVVEGGSTITEQLAKNTITGRDRTLKRKVRDAVLAYQLENAYSKDEILEMYLNTVYFGQGAYGIEAAAKTYFSRPARNLTLTEGALLAGLISSPSTYDPVFHPRLAKIQRNRVLGRMAELGMVEGTTYARARRAGLGLEISNPKQYPAPYFIDYVKRWFLSDPQFGETYEDRYDRLFKGGLRIYTTVDLRLQRLAEQAVSSILRYPSDPYGAMTVIDPRTGAIKAMVGGRNYFSRKNPFAKLNLATGGVTGRQAGSAFKPFALVTALEEGISPLRAYPAPGHIDIPLGPGYNPPSWAVDNYDGSSGGAMTLEQATIRSVNTVYAQLIMQVGPPRVVATARRMGITSRLAAVPSAVLGTNEVNTLEMASAYGTLANLGTRVPPKAVTKITDSQGQLVYEARPHPVKAVDTTIAWVANQILRKVVQEGTGVQANIGRPAAGKTGTAQEWREGWFVGFIPQLVAAVWVGFPRAPISMVYPRVRIPHVLGGTWPAEIWHAFMVNATRRMPVMDWPKPEIRYVEVAMDVTQGCAANRYTLPRNIQVVRFIAGTEPRLCTEPAGPQMVAVPSVVGLTLDQAKETLASYGFRVQIQTERVKAGTPGMVLSQDPAGGLQALQGTTVTIVVASAPEPSPIPSPTPVSSSPIPSPSLSPSPSASP